MSALSDVEANFAAKCKSFNGTTVTANGVTYTVQIAYVSGTSCYALSAEGMNWDNAHLFFNAIDKNMHLAHLTTVQEFAVVDNVTNHVRLLLVH